MIRSREVRSIILLGFTPEYGEVWGGHGGRGGWRGGEGEGGGEGEVHILTSGIRISSYVTSMGRLRSFLVNSKKPVTSFCTLGGPKLR